jgi:hypothetical protein
MRIRVRKTTFDSEVGYCTPGMVVEVNETTGNRWTKYRIADAVEEVVVVKKPVVDHETVVVKAQEEKTGLPDMEPMTKAEIREFAEKVGVFLPVKASKVEMVKRLNEVNLGE